MGEYDSGPRSLPWPLLHPLVGTQTVEDDGDYPPSSFVWPSDPDERTLVPFWLSLNEYNVLGSTIDVGSDIAYAEDALRVVWLWLRNMRIEVPICELIDDCITNNPTTILTIVAMLQSNNTFKTYIENLIEVTAPGGGGNVYPPRPTAATPDPLCNAADYVVGKIRELISGIYDDLETLSPQDVLEAFLGLFGWRASPLYQLIGLLETNDKTALLAAFDAAKDDIVCELVKQELDQTPVLSWVGANFPPPSVLGDALTYGIQSAADDGKYAQWIAVGATMTGANCDECSPPPVCFNFLTGWNGWLPVISGYARIDAAGIYRGGTNVRIYIKPPTLTENITGFTVKWNKAYSGVVTVGPQGNVVLYQGFSGSIWNVNLTAPQAPGWNLNFYTSPTVASVPADMRIEEICLNYE